jgi:hypothetical protein
MYADLTPGARAGETATSLGSVSLLPPLYYQYPIRWNRKKF